MVQQAIALLSGNDQSEPHRSLFFWCHRGLAGSWCKGIAHLHNLISGIVEKHTLEAAELIDWSDDDTDMSGISAAFLHH